MIESIEFHNFKVLRDCKLPLGPCNILVGPNGSGKSTVLRGLQLLADGKTPGSERILTVGLPNADNATTEIRITCAQDEERVSFALRWQHSQQRGASLVVEPASKRADGLVGAIRRGIRVYSLDARALAARTGQAGQTELGPDGSGFAWVLARLQDRYRDRFEKLSKQLTFWLPEFTEVTFDFSQGKRVFFLRRREGGHEIPASDLSQGELLTLALLTLAYSPEPPKLIALEEPDRGIHPRLLRLVRDAFYRLSYPESCGEDREPVQVIATTHSPYFLDLFREHPEEIVIANRMGDNVRFERLSEQPSMEEILAGSSLGEIWYTGILGGVPSEP